MAGYQRRLGRSDLKVGPLGLGCWAMGGPWTYLGSPGGWGEIDDDESVRAIATAIDLGVTFFDTAANYGTGHSERILGSAIADHRADVVIATKFGFSVDEQNHSVSRYDSDSDVVRNLRRDCEASLRRLGTDWIDLYQLHVWDYPLEHVNDLVAALEELVADGLIRWYGWSTDDPERHRAFAAGVHCASAQHDLNVVIDAAETLTVCDEFDLASVNRSPLARGALTGKYSATTEFAADDVRTDDYSRNTFLAPSVERLEDLRGVLTSDGRTLAQGALSWIWGRSERTIPIPGFRNTTQVTDNAQALTHGPLTAAQMSEVSTILSNHAPK
jgi:aryl-alcohol dehydrogenase-like predicted oxidoreductase